jgi:hypothetical protein
VFKVEIDTKGLTQNLTDVEKRQFPFALMTALNETAFQTREAWKAQIGKVFDNPTALTRNAVVYKKANKQNGYAAEILIRDEVSGGTPPSEYLKPQEFAGARKQKPFERKLANHPRGRKFYTPGKGIDLNAYGNVPQGTISKVLSQLRVADTVLGSKKNETDKGQARRLKRQRRRGGGGSYFILAQNRGKLRAGVVYERIADLSISDAGDASATSRVRSVLFPSDSAPRYTARLNAIDMAHKIFNERFEKVFRQKLRQAVESAR